MSTKEPQGTPKNSRAAQKEKSYSIGEIIKDPMQMFLFCLVIITLLAGVGFMVDGYILRQWGIENAPPGYRYPQLTDAWVTLVAAAVFFVVETYIFKPAVRPIAKSLCKEQNDEAMHNVRVNKMTKTMYCFVYFSFATIWGYLVLGDQEYMPWQLGGTGDYHIGISKKYFPFAERGPRGEQIQRYILVTAGFHVAGCVVHLVESKRNDFIEMGLHHIVAIYLFGGLYFFNLWEPGATIAFLHDIADIFVAAVKFLGETNFSNSAAVVFVTVMTVWAWTRLYTLPYLMWIIFASDIKFGNCLKEIFIYLLGCMFCLHCYWFSLFIKMISKFIKTGEAEDAQSKSEKTTSVKAD